MTKTKQIKIRRKRNKHKKHAKGNKMGEKCEENTIQRTDDDKFTSFGDK